MANKVPFLKLFSALEPEPLVLSQVVSWEVQGAAIDKKARAIKAQVCCPVPPPQELRQAVEAALARAYNVEQVELCISATQREAAEEISLPEEPPEDIPLPEEPPEEVAPPQIFDPAQEAFRRTEELRRKAMASIQTAQPRERSAGGGGKKSGGLIYGRREIKGAPIPMSQLVLDMGNVVIEGDVFDISHRKMKNREAWAINFDVTDYTGSIRISKFCQGEEAKPFVSHVEVGQHLIIQGRLNMDRYTNDMVLEPYAVQLGEKTKRKDTAGEKRVELHLHTTMSAMDALTPAKEVVKRAESWGHRAIAITDHGGAQSFPEAWHTAKGIKILYGVEAYFVNDVDDRVVVHGQAEGDFHGEIVCFDIETTGLNKNRDLIIEIGAAVLRDGKVEETFNTFASPGRVLPREIVELTGITDKMLEGAPGQEEAVNAFLDFVGDRPLAAHNAEFDMGFIAQACRRMGRPFPHTAIDTLILAQNLLPELGKYKLDMVANHLNLPAFNHHRASDDAATVAYMLIPFFERLEEMGVTTLQAINPAMIPLRKEGKARRQPKHLIVIAKNQLGLRNLYRLISDSFLKHYKRNPIMPKSEIEKYREGLIIGSACEAGELYQAVAARKSWAGSENGAAPGGGLGGTSGVQPDGGGPGQGTGQAGVRHGGCPLPGALRRAVPAYPAGLQGL